MKISFMAGQKLEQGGLSKALTERKVEVEQIVLEQYTGTTRLLNELFALAPETCYEADGVGCCKINKLDSEVGLQGPAEETIIRMREDIWRRVRPTSNYCGYHQEGSGCILGELKSPLCLGAYHQGELSGLVNFKYIERCLERILHARFDFNQSVWFPEKNEGLVKVVKTYIQGWINVIKQKSQG